MKITLKSSILLLFIITSNNILYCSTNKVTEYSTNSILPKFDTTNYYDARLYFFLTYPSCSVCINDMDLLYQIVKSTYNNRSIEIVGIINGPTPSSVIDIAKANKWEFTTLSDALNVYSKEFKIKSHNSFLLLNNNGNLIQSGEFATPTFNLDNILSDINKLIKERKEHNNTNSNNSIQEIKNIEIKLKGESIISPNGQSCLYSEKYNKFIIYENSQVRLLIADTNGNVEKEYNIKNIFHFSNPSLINMNFEKNGDKIINHFVIVPQNDDSPLNSNWHKIIEYDILKDILKLVSLPYIDSLPSDELNGQIYANTFDNGFILTGITNNNSTNTTTLSLLNNKGYLIKKAGKLASPYIKLHLNSLYREFLISDNNNYYSWQNGDSIINKFDKNFNIINSVELSFANSRRLTKMPEPTIISKNDASMTTFLNNTSLSWSFAIDKVKNHFLTLIRNYTFPKGVTELFSPYAKNEYFLNIFNENGKLISDDILLKDKSPTIIYFNNNKIFVSCNDYDKIQIKLYKFQNK